MYISQILANDTIREVQRKLYSPETVHAIIAGAFETSAKKLYRVSDSKILVVSDQQPSNPEKFEQLGGVVVTKSYNALLAGVCTGAKYRFTLKASPTKRDKSKGNRIFGHVTTEQQEEWLCGKAEANGFKLLSNRVVKRDTLDFKKQGNTITIALATFDGVLEVVDAVGFREALTRGIGRSKAYGAGLLTVGKIDG
ncbi:MAG: type I-E CRISPR-associated protein Cas6/Cse3/CasE [Oscillospiraceae bacterium]|jgi:CRISPR system Cascade subunit CasE|nr:type I-E CRISPR-associated protein Cas6/Cse3/CasE [Oscillospiraceae bacterium]